ncbi:GNAT family N-acetyltransferase [Vibrio maerlii]|uniref:GNAT family N-acetyltransferase n=1 Tax=Vibrio maerlii TaxID=2231648 RepID=UPI000E3D7B79|nr:GNAT family N-acetyltransferase [Vibrio maerlii]
MNKDNIQFSSGPLDEQLQGALSAGLESHSKAQQAPTYDKERLNWTLQNERGELVAALTADLLWDWLYISELWVDESCRGTGMGKHLMNLAETHAVDQNLSGLWLWTQSWQAADFYKSQGLEEFTRFDNFPAGHSRIGLRKTLVK